MKNGGVLRIKQHLVGGYRNAKACRQCLSEVKEEMRQYFLKKNEEKDQVNSIPDFDDVMNNDIVCLLLLRAEAPPWLFSLSLRNQGI